MSFTTIWRLPAHGDGRTFDEKEWTRGDFNYSRSHAFARTDARHGYSYFDHLAQIVRAAELASFDGVLAPLTAEGEEPLIVAGALARETRRITLIPALPAHFLSAVYTAKIATSFQRLTGGRLALRFVTEPNQFGAWHGHAWSETEQIERLDEFLTVAKGFWNEKPFTFHGSYYEVENGGFAGPLEGQPFPQVLFSGESAEAYALSAKHADVHVFSVQPTAHLKQKVDALQKQAAEHGRRLRFAIDADVIARHTDEEAWDYTRERWRRHGDAEAFDALVDDAHIWSGFGAFRKGPRAGLVGSYEAVAAALASYLDIGVDTFILAANPHLEEAYRIGEHVLPRLRARLASAKVAAE